MGNAEAKIGKNISDQLKGYKEDKPVNDYRFGSAKVFKQTGTDDKFLLLKEKWAQSIVG